ncbi:MAG: hypothetical protein US54_C0049G0002 [Candidatus Roizmanbacteria bacterium GW2011_GWA2_37_7]|uniref:Uncharacterized protein n=1 Tax=Candidatus Roizmanbacteria bacterium GW2011_GWA2_37_7 TaxID=1618481 RepID=A0A0G0JJL0_9BACT|nr:MAG: hypothetical protein US54_C0049G0002 [Candidatus Roizmanbacteria bacterium GW2011_GWA2_37_7]
MNTILKRSIMFLIVLTIIVGFLLNFIYRSSKANRITSNKEYIEQLKNAASGKNLPGTFTPTLTPTPKRPIESIIDALLSFFHFR